MIVLVAVDNRLGLSFGGRRLSRDREQLADMLRWVGERRLWIHPRSRGLFPEVCPNLYVSEEALSLAAGEDAVFVEQGSLAPYRGRITMLVLYRWNRDYPYDETLDLDLSRFTRTQRVDFPGYSHETITRELYLK